LHKAQINEAYYGCRIGGKLCSFLLSGGREVCSHRK